MAKLVGSQLYLDVFYSEQGSFGTAVANSDGSYTYTSASSAASLADRIQVVGYGDSTQPELIEIYVFGGPFDGKEGPATIVANTASSGLVYVPQAATFGLPAYIYVTNSPADQPAIGTPIKVEALSDSNTYTYVPYTPVCFATGSRISTHRGDVEVENLRVGDMAVTATGELGPIIWIGRRDIDCRGRPDHGPVRIAAHAFGPDMPRRELRLSPGHPVLVGADEDGEGGHLVPIMCLINGTTIDRAPADKVTYWHVELGRHDILLAEGLPAESYLDWGDRAFFAESTDHPLANPDFVVPGLAGRCRPVAIDGPVVEAERRRIDGMFALRLASACLWPTDEAEALL